MPIFPLNIDQSTKLAAMDRARKEGTTLSAVLRAALDAYTGREATTQADPLPTIIPAPLGPPAAGKEQVTVWVAPHIKAWLKDQPGTMAEVVTRLVTDSAGPRRSPCPLGGTAACPGASGACHGLEEEYQCRL